MRTILTFEAKITTYLVFKCIDSSLDFIAWKRELLYLKLDFTIAFFFYKLNLLEDCIIVFIVS